MILHRYIQYAKNIITIELLTEKKFIMKNQTNKRNDPMSILNQLKKLKSKGKIRTPRPTFQVKSSRVESSTTIIRKQLHSIESLQKQRDSSKTSKNFINTDHRSKEVLRIFNVEDLYSIQDCVRCLEDKFDKFNSYLSYRNNKKLFDQFDHILYNLVNNFKQIFNNVIETFTQESTQKYEGIIQQIFKIKELHQAQIAEKQKQQKKLKQKYIQNIINLTNKNLYANEILLELSKNQLNVEKYVRKAIYGCQSQDTQSSESQNSETDKTQIKIKGFNKIQAVYGQENIVKQQNLNRLPVQIFRKQYQENSSSIANSNGVSKTHSRNNTTDKKMNSQCGWQEYKQKHKYHKSDIPKNEMIRIEEDEHPALQDSWDMF